MNIYLLFNSDIVNFVLKTDGVGEGVWERGYRRPYSVIIVFWGALIVGGLDVVGLGRKPYLGQGDITCFCLFRDVRVSSKFPCVTPGVERFSLDLCRAVKSCRKCILIIILLCICTLCV